MRLLRPRLLTRSSTNPPSGLVAYPFALNLAEKVVAAMQRRETSTRDRDVPDLWVTSRRHRLDAAEPPRTHRQTLISMAEVLAHMADRQGHYTAMVGRMCYFSPQRWSDLIEVSSASSPPRRRQRSHWDHEQPWI